CSNPIIRDSDIQFLIDVGCRIDNRPPGHQKIKPFAHGFTYFLCLARCRGLTPGSCAASRKSQGVMLSAAKHLNCRPLLLKILRLCLRMTLPILSNVSWSRAA